MLDTTLQFKAKLATAAVAIRTTRTALDKAETDFRKAHDPARYFTQEERDAQAGRVLPTLDTAEKAAAQASTFALDLIREIMTVAEGAVPTLDPKDRETAAPLAVFVQEDATKLPISDLVARIRQAAAEDDRVSMFLFHRYASDRLATGAGDALADDAKPRADGTVAFARDDSDARRELASMLREIADRLRSKDLKDLAAEAVAVRSDALALGRLATKRRDQGRVYDFQTPGEIAW